MTHALRAFAPKPFPLVRAGGTMVYDDQGHAYQDLGGASHGTNLIGHNHPRVVAAIRDQADRLIHVAHTYDEPMRDAFLDRLHRALPARLSGTFLQNSGAEAVECALKMALAWTGRSRFVALEGSFHGRTLGALSVTHRPAFRAPFAGALADVTFVPPAATAIDSAVDETVAAIILEPVQGEGGVHPVPAEVQGAARQAADEHGVLLIMDEVQTGLGRTGTFLAGAPSGVQPDIVTLGKGLAGGLPVGTCSATAEVTDDLPGGWHGSTYGGSALVAAAGRAALDVILEGRLADRARDLGDAFAGQLAGLAHPAIMDVRHAGLMVAADLRVRAGPVLERLSSSGILALPVGTRGIRFLPPLTWADEERDAAVDAVAAALGPAP